MIALIKKEGRIGLAIPGPHVRERAFEIARQDPPGCVSADRAVAEVRDVLHSIGDTCPEC